MGLFDFFKRRREQESALHLPDSGSESLGSFTKDEGVVGKQVGGGGEFSTSSVNIQGVAGMAEGLEALSQIGPMIQKAMAEGNVTIEQGPSQTIDMRGSGLREEIMGIMKEHGIDAEAGTADNVQASDYGDMQQQILAALAKHGIDPNASGSTLDLRPKSEDE